MDSPAKERRKVSHSGLLEGAIRTVNKMASLPDPATKALANQALRDLLQLRRDMPTRREYDSKAR
jgi:hypothetical protein